MWLSAHLHVKINTEIRHFPSNNTEEQNNEGSDEEGPMFKTNFLALSKPLPGKPNGIKSDPYLDVLLLKKQTNSNNTNPIDYESLMFP
jgi:hypothetical protein